MRKPRGVKAASQPVPLPAVAPQPPPAATARPTRRNRNPEVEAALGTRIRAARIAAHLSQTALATAIGISFQQMQKYELGKGRVAASTLQIIGAALGVHPGSFFDDDMPAPTGLIPDLEAVMRLGRRIQRVRDPAVTKHLLALTDLLAESGGGTPAAASDATT